MLISAELRWFWQSARPPRIERWFHEGAKFHSDPEARCDRYLPQPGKDDIGIKRRGNKDGVEIKALVAIAHDEALAGIAPHFEIWGKWDAALSITEAIEVQKLRFLRVFDAQTAEAIEIPRQAEAHPEQACHLELTKLEIFGQSEVWWTLGLEALGDLAAVQDKLRKLVKHLCAGGFTPEDGDFMAYPAWLDRISSKG